MRERGRETGERGEKKREGEREERERGGGGGGGRRVRGREGDKGVFVCIRMEKVKLRVYDCVSEQLNECVSYDDVCTCM